jgi:hypothetical protein
MPVQKLRKHLSFMRDLDAALNEALTIYAEADQSDLNELREMQREVAAARRSIFIYVEKRRMANRHEAKRLKEVIESASEQDSAVIAAAIEEYRELTA